jgi:hypothetical protein
MDRLHWQSLLARPSVTATCSNHCCTCLGHLGQHNTDRIISIYVVLPKVTKEARKQRRQYHITIMPVINFTNVKHGSNQINLNSKFTLKTARLAINYLKLKGGTGTCANDKKY